MKWVDGNSVVLGGITIICRSSRYNGNMYGMVYKGMTKLGEK